MAVCRDTLDQITLSLSLSCCALTPLYPLLSGLLLHSARPSAPPGWRPPTGIVRETNGTLNAPETSTPVSAPSHPKYFTVGSTMDEVEAIMGSAQRITRENPDLWWYQSSNIAFTNGRVSHWNDASGNLKAKGSSPATAAARSLPTVTPPTTYYERLMQRPHLHDGEFRPASHLHEGGFRPASISACVASFPAVTAHPLLPGGDSGRLRQRTDPPESDIQMCWENP